MSTRAFPTPPSSSEGLPNLMAAIATGLGGGLQPVEPLPGLSENVAAAQTIILLVVDGLGEARLRRHLTGTLLDRAYLRGIDSVFPPTTASAVGTFLTGLPPAGHALTGWYQWCEEIGEILAILPLSRRGAGAPAPEAERWAPRILTLPPYANRLPVPVTHVMPAWIADTPFNRTLSGNVRQEPYAATADLFPAIERALERRCGRHFIYAYWPNYDTAAHDCGPDGTKAIAQLHRLDAALNEFVAHRRGTDALLLVTADHGFVTTPGERQLDLADHPDLATCLIRPLSGERRAAYAHVIPERRDFFVATAESRLGHALWVVPSQRLIAAGWFGTVPPHPRLSSRIGDFTLLLKEDWSLIDTRPGDRHPVMLGMHGGASRDEIRVPLCAFPLRAP